jgi:hypothetical protein
VPSVVAYPDTSQAKAFKAIAGKVAQQASIKAMTRNEPEVEKPDFVQT